MSTDRTERDDERTPFGSAQTALLDQAAELQDEHALHEGALDYAEEKPGSFWSIRVEGAHKAFGRAKILQGVDLGIPEGMITVIVGPSGTGKSVMIKHLIGLMFPDKGDVIVHGGEQDGQRYNVNWGFVEVLPDRVTILANDALKPEEIDVPRAEKHVRVIATEAAVRAAVTTPIVRGGRESRRVAGRASSPWCPVRHRCRQDNDTQRADLKEIDHSP